MNLLASKVRPDAYDERFEKLAGIDKQMGFYKDKIR